MIGRSCLLVLVLFLSSLSLPGQDALLARIAPRLPVDPPSTRLPACKDCSSSASTYNSAGCVLIPGVLARGGNHLLGNCEPRLSGTRPGVRNPSRPSP